MVSYLTRHDGLPQDGLWFDDAWVATGAIHGRLSELAMVGSAHPGFTALLMGIDALGGGLYSLALPALVAGIAGPPLLYIGLRRLGYERSISVLLASALAVAQQHIMYSGRVKGYTLDPLLILLLSST